MEVVTVNIRIEEIEVIVETVIADVVRELLEVHGEG